MNLSDYRDRLNPLLAERDHASRQVASEKQALIDAEANAVAAVEAQEVFQSVAQALQQTAHQAIAAVVTRCLRAVGFDYEFRIDFAKARGKTEAKLLFVKDGIEHDPLKMSGGGVIDVAAFSLRLVAVMLSLPQSRRILVLDEPFSRVRGERHQGKIPLLLKTLADDLGFQFVIVAPTSGVDFADIGKVVDFDE